MLGFFGYEEWEEKLIGIIEEVLLEKKALTPDLGGTATTKELGSEIVRKLSL